MSTNDEVRISFLDAPPPNMARTGSFACQFCEFESGFGFALPERELVGDISFSCRRCGRHNELNGSFESKRDDSGLRMVFHRLSLSELHELRDKLQVLAESPGTTMDEASAAVAPISKGLAAWLSNRENRDEIRTTLTLLLAGVGVVIAAMTYAKSTTPAPAVVEKVVVQLESGAATSPDLPRRAPCWCGSGSRFKNCHGRSAVTAP
ncbi:SEC-C metal-binding domain-containing protein [Arthrobacter sp. MA-N2]|uniref:SEC-C metal-binding domain-containing protein n=1 Tax=Arthrobacter sp. MA-N2 TaxID=1101188 RepID=UPI0012DE233B|nr:SEC-C domain-containing protein [Arthrobacter sp. MA-N2]